METKLFQTFQQVVQNHAGLFYVMWQKHAGSSRFVVTGLFLSACNIDRLYLQQQHMKDSHFLNSQIYSKERFNWLRSSLRKLAFSL